MDIALSGSSSVAAGYSRAVDLQVIYVHGDIKDAEALVVNDTITAPQDLKGKTIAAPFGSTTHFHLLFALEQFGIDPGAVNLVDLSPPDMAAAWERGEIDGGFVWEPALGRLKETGRVLLSSGDLSNWGRATFDAMVARPAFIKANPELTCRWVKMGGCGRGLPVQPRCLRAGHSEGKGYRRGGFRQCRGGRRRVEALRIPDAAGVGVGGLTGRRRGVGIEGNVSVSVGTRPDRAGDRQL